MACPNIRNFARCFVSTRFCASGPPIGRCSRGRDIRSMRKLRENPQPRSGAFCSIGAKRMRADVHGRFAARHFPVSSGNRRESPADRSCLAGLPRTQSSTLANDRRALASLILRCVWQVTRSAARIYALSKISAAPFPEIVFWSVCWSRENQHELCVYARKFSNLMPFGCWWFLNNPSIVEEITRERIEMLGHQFYSATFRCARSGTSHL